MGKLKGYIHPSGMLVLKKDWYYSDLYENQIKVTGFSQAFRKFLIEQNIVEAPKVKQKAKRKYRGGKHIRRKIFNASHILLDSYKYLPCLMTLTYKRQLKKTERANDHISAFMEYLRHKGKSIKAGDYWWVKELQKRGVPHFHILIDMPYIEVARLRSLWNGITKQKDACRSVDIHALDRDKDTKIILNKEEQAKIITNYVSKYCSNTEVVFDSKAYSISNNINQQQIPLFEYDFVKKLLDNISKKAKQTENGVYHGEYWDFAYVDTMSSVKRYKEAIKLLPKQKKECSQSETQAEKKRKTRKKKVKVL